MVNLLQLRVKLDWSHLVEDVDELEQVEQREAEVPDEHVRSAYDAPRPDAEHEVAWRTEGG